MIPYIYFLLPVCALAIALARRLRRLRRQRQHFIRHYQFPTALFGKMRQHIPHLEQISYLTLCAALRQFFSDLQLRARTAIGYAIASRGFTVA